MRYLVFLLGVILCGQDLHLRYPLPASATFEEVSGTVYRAVGGQQLQFDLYRPAHTQRSPVVVFLNGVGSSDLKRWPIYRDWGRVVTSRGLAGVTMDSQRETVAQDFRSLLDYLRAHAVELRVDPDNVLLWACSANVMTGLPIAMDSRNQELRAAVIYYGSGEVKDFRVDLPVLYVRVGTDDARQNKEIDATVAHAMSVNAPFTIVNLPSARHAFDALDDDPVTTAVVTQTLDFLQNHSRGEMQAKITAGVPVGRAVSAAYREEWPAAIEAFQKLVELRPRESDVRRRFGDVLLSGGEFKRAVEQYEQAIALGYRGTAWIAYSAAVASIKLGERDAAMKWIEQFKDVPPLRTRLASDSAFATLRSTPRFQEIVGGAAAGAPKP